MLDPISALIGLAAGILIAVPSCLIFSRSKEKGYVQQVSELRTRLELQKEFIETKQREFEQSKSELLESFKNLSNEALQNNNRSFLELASSSFKSLGEKQNSELDSRRKAVHELVSPIKESLEKLRHHVNEVEKSREGAYHKLVQQVQHLGEGQARLGKETANLVRSLRRPTVRGRWGEVQLRRVVELAGMVEHCDFITQVATEEDGRKVRPDMLVNLPGGKQLVVDAKVPLEAYLEAVEVEDEQQQEQQLVRHTKQVRKHIEQLGSKTYWQQFDATPEFVVLFLPGECFFSSALERDPNLIEYGMKNQVVVATPTTLIALLRAVSFGWDQQRVSEGAHEIRKIGRQLLDRLQTMSNHFEDLRKGLSKAVHGYNRAMGSLESRVLVSARRLGEISGAGEDAVPEPNQIENEPKALAIGER